MIWRRRNVHSLRTLCLWPFQTLVTRPETGPMAPELQILVTVKLVPWSPSKSGQLTNCVGGFLCRLLGRWKIVCYLFLVSLPAEVLHPWCSDALEFTFGGFLAVQVIFVHNWFKAPLDRKRYSTLPSHLPKLPPQYYEDTSRDTGVLIYIQNLNYVGLLNIDGCNQHVDAYTINILTSCCTHENPWIPMNTHG